MKAIVIFSVFACVTASAALCCADSPAVVATTTAPAPATISAPPPAIPDILLNRSIFSREQRRPQRTRVYQRPEPPRVVRLPSPIFTGAVYDQTEYVAFLEDPDSGKVTFVRAGQTLPQGRIESITLDYLMLRPADSAAAKRIDLGQNLGGEVRSASAAPAPAAAPATPTTATSAVPATSDATQPAPDGAAAPPPADSSGGADSVIERMRKRRLQEMQGN